MKIDNEFKKLVPPLTSEEFEILEKNILEKGIQDSIKTWQGIVIDGHNRYEIAQNHNLPYDTKELFFESRQAVIEWMLTNQLGRRNLSAYDRSLIALKLEDMYKLKGLENKSRAGKKSPDITEDCHTCDKVKTDKIDTKKEIAKKADISHQTLNKVKHIEQKATPEVKEKLKKGEITINKAFTDIKKEERKKENDLLKNKKTNEINGLYDVIVIDPPWPIKKIDREVRPNQIEFDYPTMDIEEIKKIKIPCKEDCHIFIWTTQKFLPITFQVINSWELKYIFTMVWHKPGGFQPINLPQYNCEFIIYARNGTPKFIDTKAFNTCFNAKRGKHSEKPEEFYDLLRRITNGCRLDMFNRRVINGFDRWGNEA